VTSLADAADRQRGIEAGASAYIPKQAFNQQLLVETLERFL
jgi:two-component system chemotaxis sensor kinase CheA